MILPTIQEVRALHEAYAPTREAFHLVHTHCEIVWEIAEQLLPHAMPEPDAQLVRAGALLHDIGVYRLYDESGVLDTRHYIRHGILGAEILRAEGYPEALGRFCSRHTGVGLTARDIREQGLDLPPGDYLAETVEEQLVMYADKFHTKTVPPKFLTPDTYAAYVRKFGRDKVRAFRALLTRFGAPDLDPLVARYGYPVE